MIGLTIDGCNITNYCQDNKMCQHGGKCLSEWHGVACDCTDTHYTGRACHFCKFLMLSTLDKIFSRQHFHIYILLIFPENSV